MKVIELIELLKEFNKGADVILKFNDGDWNKSLTKDDIYKNTHPDNGIIFIKAHR